MRSDIDTNESQTLTFEGEARETTVEGAPVVAVWTDGISLSSDNGIFPGLPGLSYCAKKLVPGRRYKVTVEEIEDEDR